MRPECSKLEPLLGTSTEAWNDTRTDPQCCGGGGGGEPRPRCRSQFKEEQGYMRCVAGWGVLAPEWLPIAMGFPSGVGRKFWNERRVAHRCEWTKRPGTLNTLKYLKW